MTDGSDWLARDREALAPSAPVRTRRTSRVRRSNLRPKTPNSEAYALVDPVIPRPSTWSDCQGHVGPCPWVGCRHHNYLEVNPVTGSIKLNFPGLEPEEVEQACSLQVASRGEHTLEETGDRLNLTRERIRQVEVRALLTLRWAVRK